jgi:cell wall-associated NlpC family hydrolase
MKKLTDSVLFLLVAFWFAGCAATPEVIRDIRTLPQDATRYLDPATAHQELITPARQQEMQEDFRRQLFLPWRETAPSHLREELVGELAKFRKHPGYGENGRQHSREWVEELARNSDLAAYPNAGFRAITVYPADLRLLPTFKPHFSSLRADGTGYPFDNLQNSAIPANTPIYVPHLTRDQSWVLVTSHYGAGWLPARDVATVDPTLTALWEGAEQVAITRDDVSVYDQDGRFLFKTGLGAQFPRIEDEGGNYRVMVAQADEQRRGQLRQAVISGDSAVLQPLRLTPANIAVMANQLMHQPYGWGGLYQNRDCSSLLKDLFVPFGLWLPRHSSHQALNGGRFSSLNPLAPEERERMILEQGIPFLTLVWVKGHIMLYLGNDHARALVFHSLWGIKTREPGGEEGRKIIGHAAITTLHPGAELAARDFPSGDLLQRVEGMTVLGAETP